MDNTSKAMLWHLEQIATQPDAYQAALAKARHHVVSHVRRSPKNGREESVVVGRIILTGDETVHEIEARMASHGFDPSCHRISLDGHKVSES